MKPDQPSSPSSIADDVGADVVNLTIDPEWLDQVTEDAIEPDLPIIDAHHHLWDRPGFRYMPPDLLRDIAGGHNVIATVYVEVGAMHRADGPELLRPAGETEMVAAFADSWPAQPARPKFCAGIVPHADLRVGSRVVALLEAHIEAGRDRMRGIRQNTAWDAVPSLQQRPHYPRGPIPPGVIGSRSFREGFAQLAPLGLSYDAWVYQPQLPEVLDLARAFPDTSIILNHVGGPLRTGPYRGRSDELFAEWSAIIGELAACPNVTMKIGGMGMRIFGFDLRDRERPPGSRELADLWRPYVEGCVEAFGASRCMFESNFPVDKAYYSYNACWNAFKLLTAAASADERDDLFRRTAARVYRLAL
jgi:predicted TIM-barrel fold metal-dependent hydrolase